MATQDSERILKLLEEVNENANSLGRKLGHRDGTRIYYVLNGRNGISEKMAEEIKKQYPWISVEWLLRGYGEMYERDNTMNGYSNKLKAMYNGKIGEDNVMEVVIPEEGEMFAYTMKGNSMIPEYLPGDILGCQVVSKDSLIEYGRKFMIKTTNGIVVRKVMPGTEPSKVLLVSADEKKFPTIQIAMDDIQKLAVINNYIRMD
jgi:hypothetical protein